MTEPAKPATPLCDLPHAHLGDAIVAAINAHDWQAATGLLIRKVDELYRAHPIPRVDVGTQVQLLTERLAEHEDMSNLRHGLLLERFIVLEQMVAAQPTLFSGTAELPFWGPIPINVGPMPQFFGPERR
jgi:hypothetical protein